MLDTDPSGAEHVLAAAAAAGVDLSAITAELEREGVQSFADSYTELVRCIEYKRAQIAKDLEESA